MRTVESLRMRRSRSGWTLPIAARWALLALALSWAVAARASLPPPEGARAEAAFDDGEARVEARLLVHPDDRDALRAHPREGEPAVHPTLRVGVLLDLDPGWHLYWRNPGETGLPTELRWQIEGGRVGPVAWPAPSRFREADDTLTVYGYTDQVLLASEAVLDPLPAGRESRRAHVSVSLLVCETRCIPAELELERSLSPRAASDAADSDARTRSLFATYAARVPRAPEAHGISLELLLSQSRVRPGDAFRAAIAVECEKQRGGADACPGLGAGASAELTPDAMPGLELRPTGVRRHPETGALLLTFDGRASGGQDRLRGVLTLRGTAGDAVRHVEVALPIPRARAGAEIAALGAPWLEAPAAAPAGGGLPMWRVILVALLGGLILNLMPCVLPVLAIKVCAVAELAHRDRRRVVAHGAAYAMGVLVTMSLLAAVVLALRAAGTAVGWGFQFQEPLFVAAVTLVVVAFALNLFGVFEIQLDTGGLAALGAEATGARRSFFEGLLAVVLATPCSAPFLGTAVGFAFAGSSAQILAVFLAIGTGLALPFVLVTLVPGWSRVVPRSGAWMLELRKGLGFALLGSAVWLLWILGRAAGNGAVIEMLALLVAAAFALWVYGTLQASGRRLWRGVAAVGLATVIVAGLNVVSLESAPEAQDRPASEVAWSAFEPASVQARLAEGRAVFVVFTADWCLTCKMNERLVLSDERVREEIERLGVAVFRADWTQRDERIRAELARFGRAGVPMYLLYAPGSPGEPRVLPEVLTVEGTLRALRAAAADGATRIADAR